MGTNNLYTTKTAALKATKADISKLDAKKLLLNGKNILDYISESGFDSYDSRDPQLKNDELDIWNSAISLSDNGHIEVKPLQHTVDNLTDEQKNIINWSKKIINNEVIGENDDLELEHKMYWQTEGLFGGSYLFDGLNGAQITTFESDLTNLLIGQHMFSYCNYLTSFKSNLSNLLLGANMFEFCNNLTSFKGNLSSLTNGGSMFYNCTNLTSFSSNLSNLTKGIYMFNGCKLDAPSVANIVHTLPTHAASGTITIGIGCDDTEAGKLLFAQECDCETWQELLDDFSAKNWTVTFQCNGRPTV